MNNIIRIFTIILLGALYACSSTEEIKPVPEYVALQPKSFKVTNASSTNVNAGISYISSSETNLEFEFYITNFEPQSYEISLLSTDANGWITGQATLLDQDISSTAPAGKVTGSIPLANVFSPVQAGESEMIRLTLTSALGNVAVAEPWLTMTLQ